MNPKKTIALTVRKPVLVRRHQHNSGLAPEAVLSASSECAEGLVVVAAVQPRQRRQRVASVALLLRMVAEGVVSNSQVRSKSG